MAFHIHHCVLGCIASCSAAQAELLAHAHSAIMDLSWDGFPAGEALRAAVRAICADATLGTARKKTLCERLVCRSTASESESEAVKQWGADELARAVRCNKIEESWFFRRHASICASTGLPCDPAGYTPTAFIAACNRRRVAPSDIKDFFESARACTLLLSKRSSLKPMAAALSAWGRFSKYISQCDFPVTTENVISFASTCRNPGTFTNYASGLKLACELLGHSTDWYSDERVKRAREGIKKSQYVYNAPKMAVTRRMIDAIAINMEVAIPERIFCTLSWAFLLRARSETAVLKRACPATFSNHFAPIQPGGEVGLVGQKLTIRLRSRKNRMGGDTVVRTCSCASPDDISSHIPKSICPVHVLWPWIVRNTAEGKPIFKANIADTAQIWLKVALEARNVPEHARYTLHSLRRGAARALVASGGSLSTILRAGSWKSSAFLNYLDVVGVENALMTGSLQAIFECDDLDE